jgi:hypothetical protein
MKLPTIDSLSLCPFRVQRKRTSSEAAKEKTALTRRFAHWAFGLSANKTADD